MHIPENLPQFEKDPVLIAVCGSKTGRAFLASSRELSELFFIDHSEIKYSDDEGFFGSKANGGSPEAPVDDMEEAEFLSKFGSAVSKAIESENPKEIYLLAPSETAPAIVKVFPEAVQSTIIIKNGNYVDRHFTEILSRIAEI